MTETNVESGQPNGAEGITNPNVSKEGGSPVAVDADALSRLVKDAIAAELKPIKGEISGIYSRQDKDRNALREFMDEVKKQQANGLSENDAIDAAQNALNERAETVAEKKMIREIHAKLFGSSSTQPAGNGPSGAEQAQIISEYKLDGNDPEVIAAYSLSGDSFRAKIADIAYRRATKQPASIASVPAASVSPSQGGADTNVLISKLSEYQKFPTKHKKEIAELEAELNKRGWK